MPIPVVPAAPPVRAHPGWGREEAEDGVEPAVPTMSEAEVVPVVRAVAWAVTDMAAEAVVAALT
ncbi:hypothetical protein GCM10007898_31610 [Dyella flagellata]|uniref:Uncharacterized protein n=1 Tax=Dyella flagellata TaxID=1867833 RepID=A0ABQ5XG26_9GAMM|nr:hypothetical protein GCM10007898_31610 [Dyella flagellata]